MKNQSKLIVLVGISGSGKSTWARKYVLQNPSNRVIVSRDTIRMLLFGYNESNLYEYYNRDDVHKLEKEVSKYCDTLIYEGIETGKEIILDNTHLKRAYIEKYKYWNVPVEIKFVNWTISTKHQYFRKAKEQNALRVKRVSEDVLNKQKNQFLTLIDSLEQRPIDFTPIELDLEYNVNKKDCIIFDIDGTLAEKGDRNPYDWTKVDQDNRINFVWEINRFIKAGDKYMDAIEDTDIIICTGRSEEAKELTLEWLHYKVIYYDKIYFRDENDYRPDWIVKQEMWEKINKTHNIISMFDDRLQVVRRARALGFKVFHVEYNNF